MNNRPGDSLGEEPDVGSAGAPDPEGFGSGGQAAGSADGSAGSADAIDAELADLLDSTEVGSGEAGVAAGGESPPPPQPVPLTELEQVTKERDDYLDGFRRLQAEFENYKKAVAKREADSRARANDSLVSELLPVLDACALAIANPAAGSNPEDIARVQTALVDALTRQGLEVLDPTGAAFDPEQHEAVMHEEGDGSDGLVVAEVLRIGYGWKGHVIRPAMVKTQG